MSGWYFKPALLLFVLSAAVYMDVNLGASPYDALPFIISGHIKKMPFRRIRMIYDFAVIMIACVLSGKLQIVTILMAPSLGHTVTWVGNKGRKLFLNIFPAEELS